MSVKAVMFVRGKGLVGIFRPPAIYKRYDELKKSGCVFQVRKIGSLVHFTCLYRKATISLRTSNNDEENKERVDELINEAFYLFSPLRRN